MIFNVDFHLLKFNMVEEHEFQKQSYEYERQMKTWLKVAISSIPHLKYLAHFWVMLWFGLKLLYVTIFRASYYSSFCIIQVMRSSFVGGAAVLL